MAYRKSARNISTQNYKKYLTFPLKIYHLVAGVIDFLLDFLCRGIIFYLQYLKSKKKVFLYIAPCLKAISF